MTDMAANADLMTLAEELRPVLLRASRQLRREAQRVGASALDAQLLNQVRKRPGIGASELAEIEQIARPTMSAHLKRLDEAGWLRMEPDPDDRRRAALTLTPKGVKALDAIRRQRNDWLVARLAQLPPEARTALAGAVGPLEPSGGGQGVTDFAADDPIDARRKAENEAAAAIAGEPVAERVEETQAFSSLPPLIIGSAMLMQTLNATVLSNALPHMAVDLREDPVTLNLAITTYMLSSAVFLPVSAWAADRFGARRIFTIAIILFALSSAACGFAQNLTHLILARMLQGVAGAMMAPVGRLILLRTTPKHDLVRAMAVLTMPSMLGPVIGPPLGGAVVTFGDWRWIFFFNVPIAIVGVFLVTRFLKEVKEEGDHPLDWIGSLLVGLGLAGVIYGLESLRDPRLAWWQIAWPILAGAVFLAAYGWHAKRTPHAVLDLSLLRVQTFSASVVGGAFMRMGMGATPFLLALLLQLGFGLNPFEAGLMTFASAAAALAMKTIAPPILARFGFKRVLSVNALIVAASFLAYVFFKPGVPYWIIVATLVVGGFFRSLQFTALNGLAFADVEQRQMSRASSMSTMGQQLSQTLGISFAAVLVGSLMTAQGLAHPNADVVAPAFGVVGLVTLVSMLFFLRLPENAGEELHSAGGRRPRG